MEHLKQSVLVMIEAEHMCMTMRGIKSGEPDRDGSKERRISGGSELTESVFSDDQIKEWDFVYERD